jgi:hypothetical protein
MAKGQKGKQAAAVKGNQKQPAAAPAPKKNLPEVEEEVDDEFGGLGEFSCYRG